MTTPDTSLKVKGNLQPADMHSNLQSSFNVYLATEGVVSSIETHSLDTPGTARNARTIISLGRVQSVVEGANTVVMWIEVIISAKFLEAMLVEGI